MKIEDLMWVVGFLEGEGTFYFRKRKNAVTGWVEIKAVQKDREPLDMLVEKSGTGKVNGPYNNTNGEPIYTWSVSGKRDEIISFAWKIFPYLSERRKIALSLALDRDADSRAISAENAKLCRRKLHLMSESRVVKNGSSRCGECRKKARKEQRSSV